VLALCHCKCGRSCSLDNSHFDPLGSSAGYGECGSVVAETIIMSKPAKYCEISLNAGAWTGEPSRSAPFLVEKMAIQAGASATVALALGNAYRNCNPNELPAEVFIGVIKQKAISTPKMFHMQEQRGSCSYYQAHLEFI